MADEVTTVTDAVRLVKTRIRAQVARAQTERVLPNAMAEGDADVKELFLMLLPLGLQRRVFLETIADMSAWPRLYSLFGAPPYHFLRPGDAAGLRAGGLSHRRQNMASENSIPTHSQFGHSAHFTDQHDREFLVFDTTAVENDLLPCNLPHTDTHIRLVVKVKKRSQDERIRRLRDAELRKTITFPMPRDVLTLRQTAAALRAQSRPVADALTLTVKVLNTVPRDKKGLTALIMVKINE